VADNYKDFDAAVEAEDILKFTMMGKDYELSSQLPAKVILTQMRHMDETGVVPTSVIPEWLEALLGKKVLDELLEKGATWPALEGLLNWLLTKYGIAGGEVEIEEGEDSPK
tara:strand:- start:401 stop:733 length:333 start_codon:yes stop_codon:yes gene_type:complete